MTHIILMVIGAFAFGLYLASVVTEARAAFGAKNPGAVTGAWALYILVAVLLIKIGIFLA